ncbi:ExbD/TolR family protein [Methylomonas methanica]|uniref:Biopolymer transport protein ExbD/TolR n=1 Tax=Methylomonas methanica (strain DSM 25384 / MC09) TaxID=857087 RepID=F9ZYF0_METMM|nr:biopolymer transporter ExbD [Methylomonas methanica]AEG01055.1 Biopolymer transport protein ExbD/TolR [Methylomonas methanica MC09]
MEFRRKKRAPVEIGLIPMIDVLLVLLFFFMVATTFRHHTDLKINLPEANGEEVDQAAKSINLFIDADGKYALAGEDGKPQPLADQSPDSLKNALAGLSGDSHLLPFIISADGKTPHQAVVSALDIANQLGFHHITFAINPPERK